MSKKRVRKPAARPPPARGPHPEGICRPAPALSDTPVLSAEPADPPAPGSLRFTLVQDLRVIVEGEGFKSVFHLDDKEVLAPAQRTWRRISGRPDGRADKLGPGTIDLLLAVDDFVETYGRDVGLTPGELARRIAAHAAKAGITDRLDESGPLREACERLLTFWRQRKRYAPG